MNTTFDQFVREYLQHQQKDIITKDETKPWGAYYVFEETAQQDKKVLKVLPSNYLSLQFHGTPEHPGHAEDWVALTDFVIVLGTQSAVSLSESEMEVEITKLHVIRVQKDDSIHIPSGYLHALVNPFESTIYVQETRTSSIIENSSAREKNIVRIFDQTGRDGLPNWPEWLIEKIKQA